MGNCLPVGTLISTPLLDGGPWVVTQDWGCTDRTIEEPNCTNCSDGCFTCDYFHAGIDIGGRWIFGTPVHALASGRCTRIGFDVGGCDGGAGCGTGGGKNAVCIWSGSNDYWFFHLSQALVQVGDAVTENQVVGKVGSCGCSTGPHLHFQVMPHGVAPVCSRSINPCGFLGEWPGSKPGLRPESTAPPPGDYLYPLAAGALAIGGLWAIDRALR